MHQKLPKEIDPFRLAQNGLKLEGLLPLAGLSRLAKYLHNTEGEADIKMDFETDEVGTPYMRGEFKATVSVVCERCMQPMTLNLDAKCLLAMIIGERKIEGLAEQYDPWMLENNDPILLKSVIEDEFILSLPLVPRHDEACLPDDVWSVGEEEVAKVTEERISPFAMLESLKTKD